MPHPAGPPGHLLDDLQKTSDGSRFFPRKGSGRTGGSGAGKHGFFCLVRRRREIIPAPGLYGDKRTAAIHAGGHVDGRRTRLFDPIQKSQQRIGKTAGGDMHERNVFQGREI